MRTYLVAASLTAAMAASAGSALADNSPIKVGTALDFTAVYTFVTAEYSQGQRDYLSRWAGVC